MSDPAKCLLSASFRPIGVVQARQRKTLRPALFALVQVKIPINKLPDLQHTEAVVHIRFAHTQEIETGG